ncbi:hypothetical protein [Schleiferilactobacillus harbinensis]|uniref:hypothetical protein n=1 Tax=Schleiferilactobacillus harbinensis TaxID=304207 RepID=UPI0007B94CEB|nr:hypothetical protein [Schleiferilactobacillus harbinensis]
MTIGNKLKAWLMTALTLSASLAGVGAAIATQVTPVQAASITTAPGYQSADHNNIPTTFEWVAKVVKGITKATPFGDVTWATAGPVPGATWKTGYNDFNYAFNVYDPKAIANKGNFGVFYDTIGNYQGRLVDMTATVVDWIVPKRCFGRRPCRYGSAVAAGRDR